MQKRLTNILTVLAAIIAINILASFVFFRWDLTQEKRFTVAEGTKNVLGSLEDQVFVTVYLSGDLPAGFERLEAATRETLDDFKAYAGTKMSVRYVDIAAETNPEKRSERYAELEKKGMVATNVFAGTSDQRTEKLLFPYALLSYKGRETPVLLLKGNKTATAEQQLNQSYEGIEFELITGIKKITQTKRKRMGLIVSHTKVSPERFSDLIATLQQNYDLFFDVDGSGKVSGSYAGLDAILVPKPDVPFTDAEKYQIDQFVVNGGRALFFVDGARVDSISAEGTFALPLSLNLDDLFFKYGFRINPNLVKDLSCAYIPLNVGNSGEKPNIQPMPWRFFPLINNFGKHPIVRNLDAIYTKFTSTIDTVRAEGIKKTPLLMTSQYTKTLQTPAAVAYNEARQKIDPTQYNGGVQTVAYLLEGKFESLYKNRVLPSDPRHATFRAQNKDTKIVVCSDGDVLINDIDYKRQAPLPLGFDKLTRNIFANKDFILYAVDYLLDDNGLITARNKQVTLRPLDKLRLKEEKNQWQALNMVLPVVLVLTLGGLWQWYRRRQFA